MRTTALTLLPGLLLATCATLTGAKPVAGQPTGSASEARVWQARFAMHLGGADGPQIGTVELDLREGVWHGQKVHVFRSIAVTPMMVGHATVILDRKSHEVLAKQAAGHDALHMALFGATKREGVSLPFRGDLKRPHLGKEAVYEFLAIELGATRAQGSDTSQTFAALVDNVHAENVTVSSAVSESVEILDQPRQAKKVTVTSSKGEVVLFLVEGHPLAVHRRIRIGGAELHWIATEIDADKWK